MGLVALGIGAGLGLAAYRNLPSVEGPSVAAVLIVWAITGITAYLQGRRVGLGQWQFQVQEQEQSQAQQQIVNVHVMAGKRAQPVPAIEVQIAKEETALHQAQSESRALEKGGADLPPVTTKARPAEGCQVAGSQRLQA